MSTKPKTSAKVCPNKPKGERCPLCGMAWICGRKELPKAGSTPSPATKENKHV